jgi:hypothetical protein
MNNKTEKKPLEGLARAADHIVGDIVLGTLGRVAFHIGQVPVVGNACHYVGENVRDGYRAAEASSLRKRLAAAIVDATTKAGKPLSSDTLRSMAIDFGVPESSLDEVKRLVEQTYQKKDAKAFPTPAAAEGAAA